MLSTLICNQAYIWQNVSLDSNNVTCVISVHVLERLFHIGFSKSTFIFSSQHKQVQKSIPNILTLGDLEHSLSLKCDIGECLCLNDLILCDSKRWFEPFNLILVFLINIFKLQKPSSICVSRVSLKYQRLYQRSKEFCVGLKLVNVQMDSEILNCYRK